MLPPRPLLPFAVLLPLLLCCVSPLLLAADAGPVDAAPAGDSSTRMIIIGILVVVGIGLLNAVGTGVGIWKNLRHEPPLHTLYATKKEAGDLEARINDRLSRVEDDVQVQLRAIGETQSGLQKAISDINRLMGRIEGTIEGLKKST